MQNHIIPALVIKSSMGGVQIRKGRPRLFVMLQLVHVALGGFHKGTERLSEIRYRQ